MNEEYRKLARYYDQIHTELQDDVGFIQSFASRQNGELLELGCGTGRLLIPLARSGYTISGLDNSPDMLAIARERIALETPAVQANITLEQADMTDIQGTKQFAGALVSYNTIMHLDRVGLGHFLTSLKPRLTKDAQLLVDFANPHLIEATPADKTVTLERTFLDPASQNRVMQFATSWLEPVPQQLFITWWFDEIAATNGAVSRVVSEMVYNYFFLHQLTGIFVEHGYQIVDILGDYDETPFAEESDRLLLIAGV